MKHAVCHHFEEDFDGKIFDYSSEIEEKISELEKLIKKQRVDEDHLRWHAIKLLEHDEEEVNQATPEMLEVVGDNLQKEIIYEKYEYIEEIINETILNKNEKIEKTDRVDKVLTHRIFGVPIFLGIMALVFLLTFTVGDLFKLIFEVGLTALSDGVFNFLTSLSASDWIISLVVDGIIAGVGGILTFLPNIFYIICSPCNS